jgi:hypothetical protein
MNKDHEEAAPLAEVDTTHPQFLEVVASMHVAIVRELLDRINRADAAQAEPND